MSCNDGDCEWIKSDGWDLRNKLWKKKEGWYKDK
jgi:hypothetical protein